MEPRLLEFIRKYNYFKTNGLDGQIEISKNEYNITDDEMKLIIRNKLTAPNGMKNLIDMMDRDKKKFKIKEKRRKIPSYEDYHFEKPKNRGMFVPSKKQPFYEDVGRDEDRCENIYELQPCITNRQYNTPPKIQYNEMIHYSQDDKIISNQHEMIDSIIDDILTKTSDREDTFYKNKKTQNIFENQFSYISDDIQNADHVVFPIPVGGFYTRQYNHFTARTEYERESM